MLQDFCQALLLPEAVNSHPQLNIDLNIIEEFQIFVADKTQAIQLFKTYQWLRNKYQKGIKAYNQLLRDKTTLDSKNKRPE